MINVNCQRFALIAGLFLVGSVMIGVLPVDAATSSGKCLKAGIVQTTKSAKYKCTKSGAVLKWVKVASTAAKAIPSGKKGMNGAVGITSWTTTVSPNPVKPGAQFTVTSVIKCGPIMSLTGSPRYPDLGAWSNSSGFTGVKFGVPVLSNGGNTATFVGTATAPATTGDIKVWTYVRDFGAPNACTGDVNIYKNTGGESFLTLKVSNNAASLMAVAGKVNTAGGNCSKVGDKSTVSGGYLECRTISGGTNNWFKLSSNPVAVSVPVGGDSLDACKLREARKNKFQAWNIGFPRGEPSGWNPVSPTGNSRVQLIAIDFEDVPGSSKQLEGAEELIQKFNDWFRFFSNEKKDFSWQFPKQWIRMSKKSTDYQYTVNDTGPNSIQREIIQSADPLINFSNSDFAFVLLPQTIEAFNDGIAMVGRSIISDEGEIRNIVGAGSWTYRNGYPGGPSIHEILHPMGLAGHAPRGADNHAMDTGSDVLNMWDAFLLGWIESDELFCMPTTMNIFEGSLIPLERKQHGFRGVIVPLSSTEALVVQSHRAENWGAHLDPGTYGLAVYYVDTTKDVDRTDESKGIVNETWSKYVGGESRYKRLLLVGDTATYKNIKVELLKSGDNDLFRITKS